MCRRSRAPSAPSRLGLPRPGLPRLGLPRLVLLGLALLWPAAADAASLRPRAEIAADQVTLGDLFEGLPAQRAAVPIARAPIAGQDVVLDSAWVARVARTYGVDYRPADPHERITLTRASQRIGQVVIAEALRRRLAEQLGDRRIDLQFDGRDLDLHLPAELPPTVALEDLTYEPVGGRFTAQAVAPAEGPPAARLRITGRAVTLSQVPVPNRRLGSGEVVGAADIDWIEVAGDRGGDTILAVEEMIGMAARRTLPAGTPIRRRDLQRPVVIGRGDTVTMVLSSGGLTITARGRALEAGGDGDAIRVINLDSNRTVQATVSGPNAVVITLGATASLIR